MSVAYWCLFAAFLLPYVFTVIAKAGLKDYSNKCPRESLAKADGYRKRANFVQANSFESLPFFAASVIIAHQHTPPEIIDRLAIAFVVARVLYGLFYLFDLSAFRTLAWSAGVYCCISLMLP